MSEKSKNPFDNLDQHDNVAGPSNTNTTSPLRDEDPPPYTITTTPSRNNSTSAQSNTQQSKPIAIPAVEPSFDSAFIRAYAPVLMEYNLPQESFFTFLDQLNKVISNSPPLQILDAAGGILQSVPILFPLHWLGSTVSGLANLGSQGVSKSRTDSHIRQANQDIFGPRGLKAEIVKLDALAYIANMPILDLQGKVSQQTELFQRLLNETGTGNDKGSTATTADGHQPQGVDVQQQRIRILQPWIAAELTLDILPWTSKSKLTRSNAALKKRNAPGQRETGGQKSNDETGFQKCLWLVIEPTERV